MTTLRLWPIARTLAVFSAVMFTLDVLLGVLFPSSWVMQKAWELLLPGFTFISWGTIFVGLVESFIGGFLTAAVFVPVLNYLVGREAPKGALTIRTSRVASARL
ncbi:MAG: hypothetical protein V1755_10880 [Chloroflexota bacterium]